MGDGDILDKLRECPTARGVLDADLDASDITAASIDKPGAKKNIEDVKEHTQEIFTVINFFPLLVIGILTTEVITSFFSKKLFEVRLAARKSS